MFQCNDCSHVFDRPAIAAKTNEEDDRLYEYSCPKCGADNFEELPEDNWRDR